MLYHQFTMNLFMSSSMYLKLNKLLKIRVHISRYNYKKKSTTILRHIIATICNKYTYAECVMPFFMQQDRISGNGGNFELSIFVLRDVF